MHFNQLRKKLKSIKSRGFIKTHRAHDTGIGKTLEDLLGIKENNLRNPDCGEIELKTKRIESPSMITLATIAPKPKGITKVLFEKYKYLDDDGYYNLHTSIYGSKFNPQGFRLKYDGGKLILRNRPHNIYAYYDRSLFRDILPTKSNTILLVFAHSKGKKRSIREHFHYTEAYLLQSPKRLSSIIGDNRLMVDIRIGAFRAGEKRGQYHDHGTAFRISKSNILQLYNSYIKIL